jgi:hypothetical protein
MPAHGEFLESVVWLLMATAAVVAVAVVAALSGIGMAVCLVILMLAPAVTVVGYEVRGYRHQAESPANQKMTQTALQGS